VAVSVAWKVPEPEPTPMPMTALAPLDLAESIIASDPNVMILDLRTDRAEAGIPGAYPVDDSTAVSLLQGVAPTVHVIVYDENGLRGEAPVAWPRTLTYQYVRGGLAAWAVDVMTPMDPTGYTLDDRDRMTRQHQIAAYFSGSAVTSAAPPPPPAAAGGGSSGQKRRGGC